MNCTERDASIAHVRARPESALSAMGLVRKVVAVVPNFSAALAVARTSDLVALLPASFIGCRTSADAGLACDEAYAFELPVATEKLTVSQMWHPRLEADPAHRWFRQLVVAVCRRQFPL